jgi:hypothetical protein
MYASHVALEELVATDDEQLEPTMLILETTRSLFTSNEW